MFCSLLICFYFHKKETYPVLEGVHDNVFFSAFHLLYHQFILIGMTLYFRKYNFPLKTDILMSRFKQYIFFLIFAYCPSGVFLTTTSVLSYFFLLATTSIIFYHIGFSTTSVIFYHFSTISAFPYLYFIKLYFFIFSLQTYYLFTGFSITLEIFYHFSTTSVNPYLYFEW